jgi:hypothetical protein
LSYQIPTVEPTQAVIGTSWYWDATYADFPASDGWTLTYHLRGATDADFITGTDSVTITANGSAFEVRIPATKTAGLTAGKYRLTGRVSLAGEIHVVYSAHLLALTDPTNALDAASFNRQMLDALETAMVAGVASGSELQTVTINGRTISYRDRAELNAAHAHYSLLVAIEENPHGSLSHAAEFVRG